jgi:peptide/nickel transport system ATP-binding protein
VSVVSTSPVAESTDVSQPRAGLRVTDLRVALTGGAPVLEGVDLTVPIGRVLGIVGESGSGKTTVGMALSAYARPGAEITGGEILIDGVDVLSMSKSELQRSRGNRVAYVPQDPATALNPSMRLGDQIIEMLRAHGRAPARGEREAVLGRAFERVGLPGDRSFARRYPHEVSGGQQQRVVIACALACNPRVLVLDEPTTGLDVLTQQALLEEIANLENRTEMAIVYISHDLAVVAEVADRIAVIYGGRVVEEGESSIVLSSPKHPYSCGLVSSIPDHVVPRRLRGINGLAVGVGGRPTGCAFAPRCGLAVDSCHVQMPALVAVAPGHAVRCTEWQRTPAVSWEPRPAAAPDADTAPILSVQSLRAEYDGRGGLVVAVNDISFIVRTGESVALVGESGSGKTTLARVIAGLHAPAAGAIELDGEALAGVARKRSKEQLRRLQIIFQNPFDSLNPQRTVADAVEDAARVLRGISNAEARAELGELLERVRLPRSVADRRPPELSGGECQRVAIMRALAAKPELLVCDEITSALDVSVQAAVLGLLEELRDQMDLSLLFITHDLGVVASVADRVLVMRSGEVCEEGSVTTILEQPTHEYTRRLLAAAPSIGSSTVPQP